MLSINLENDWALRGLQKDIFYALYIFIFQPGSLLPVYDQPNNAATSLDRICEIHSRIFPRRSHTQAHTYTYASLDTKCTQTLPKVYSTEYPNRRCAGQKEKREGGRGAATEREVDGGRRGGGGSSTSSTWRNEHTRVHSHTVHARGETLQADRPGNLFLPAPFPCARAFRKSFERAAKFRRIRRRAWITWIISAANITSRFCPELCVLSLSQPVNSMWQLIKRVIPWLNILVEFKWLGRKSKNVI